MKLVRVSQQSGNQVSDLEVTEDSTNQMDSDISTHRENEKTEGDTQTHKETRAGQEERADSDAEKTWAVKWTVRGLCLPAS